MTGPWNFARIPGMEEEKAQLRLLAGGERIPHALLFLGDYGTASLGLALAFARLVLCTQPQSGEPCEQCPACQKTRGWVHPDLHFSFPFIKTREQPVSRFFLPQWRERLDLGPYFSPQEWSEFQQAKDVKLGNINIDECREIIQKMSFTAVEGAYRILVLWGAEFLGKEGNVLLKLLEEPPKGTIFLIVAAEAERILPTILSRCQLIKVRRFRDEEIREALVAQALAGESEAEQWSFLADGNLGEALHAAGEDVQPAGQTFLAWMRACYPGVGLDALRLAEKLAAFNREDAKAFLHYALHFTRQMVFAAVGLPQLIRLSESEKEAARRLAAQLDPDRLEEMTELFAAGLRAVERNANARILFTHLSIQVHALLRDKMRYLARLNAI